MSPRLSSPLVCLCVLLTLGGCAEPYTPMGPSRPVTPPSTVPSGPGSRLSALTVGCPLAATPLYRSMYCTAQATDQDGRPLSAVYTWSSSDESLAHVSDSGRVTALAVGTVTLTASATLGDVTVSGQVTISTGQPHAPTLHASSLSTSETWRAADNPHLVRGQLEVGGASQPLLTLEPGAVVLFAPDAELRITTGALQALGWDEQPILLSAEQPTAPRGSWRGLVFSGANGSSQLVDVTLSQCGSSLGTGACLSLEKGAAPRVYQVTVRGSGSVGVQVADDGSAFGTGSASLSVQDGAGPALRLAANAVGSLSSLGLVRGNALDAIEVLGTVTTSQTWPAVSVAYVFAQSLFVQGPHGPRLTLPAGSQLRFAAGTGLYVGATDKGDVVMNGTASAPVLLTADSATPTPGAWKGVYLGQQGDKGSDLANVVIEYAGQPFETGDAADLVLGGDRSVGSSPLLEEVTLREGGANGLVMAAASVSALRYGSRGLHVRDNARAPFILDADQAGSLPLDTTPTGNGGGAVIIRPSNITHGQTWPRMGLPYLIQGLIQVGGGDYGNPILTLLPGTELRFVPSAGLVMGLHGMPGALSAVGTPDAPIRFLPDTAPSAPGAGWTGLTFWSSAVSTLSYVDVTSGGLTGQPGAGNLNVFRELGAFVTHSTFRGSAGCGATVSSGREDGSSPVTTDFTYPGFHNTFIDNAGGAQCATTP